MTLLALSPDVPQALLATIAIRASGVLAIGWLLTTLLRRSAASTRHAIWAATLGTLVLLPVASLIVPRWEMRRTPEAVPAVMPSMPAVAASSLTPAGVNDHATAYPAAADEMRFGFDPAPAPRSPLPVILLVIAWGLGAAFGLGRLSAGWAAARRLVRRATPVPAEAQESVRALAEQMGIRRDVRALAADGITVPVNLGLLRPVILLPLSGREWTRERLHVVLLHELAHVRRWDYASLLLMEAARALYWINPLVWLAARRANVELERACDDEVLRAGTRSVDYAEHLYAIAASLAGHRTPSGALAMAQPSTLRARVGAILASRMDRSPMRPRALAGAAAMALVIGIPLASLRLLGEGRDAATLHRSLADLTATSAALRGRAAFALGTLKSTDARAPLTTALRDADPGVRGMAAWALGNIGSRGDEPAMTAVLRDPDADVREMAVLALGSLGDRAAAPALSRLTADPMMGVRGVLTHALWKLGGAQAITALTAMALHDPDEHVRDMAIYSLRLTAGHAALPTLILVLRDSSAQLRTAAANNLTELADPGALDALAATARHDPEWMVRASASWALGQLKDARAAEPLSAASTDTIWHVRASAVGALALTPGPRAEEALIAATRDPVHQVRLSAVASLTTRARQ